MRQRLREVTKSFRQYKNRFVNEHLREADSTSLKAIAASNSLQTLPECDLTPAVTDENAAKFSDFEWPLIKPEPLHARFTQKFMHSFKNIYSPNINASNLMFITGKTKGGKSYFLRSNLKKFTSKDSHNPVVFHFDFSDQANQNINFDTFLFDFEHMMIDQIVRHHARLFPNGNSIETTLKVALKFYEKQLLEQSIAKSIDRVLGKHPQSVADDNGVFSSYGYSLYSADSEKNACQESLKELEDMHEKYKHREYKQTVFIQKFGKVAEMIGKLSPECSDVEDQEAKSFKAALLLLYDVIIQKELARRKKEYQQSSGSRDGQDCMNFLFDLVNDCAGYTKKYYEELPDQMDKEQLVEKYWAEKAKYIEKGYAESELLGDSQPHCLLVIEGVERLYRMGARYKQYDAHHDEIDSLASDYLDSMILRLDTGTQGKWFRNHFPVIFETTMSQYFNETIYNDMQQNEMHFPTLEFTGYTSDVFTKNLSHFFNTQQTDKIVQKLGTSVYLRHIFTERLKQKDPEETFSQLIEMKDDPVFNQVRREYEHRINSLFCHPCLGDLLDTGEIDFHVMNIFEWLAKNRYTVDSEYAREELMVSPMFEALFDTNIIWKSKYFDIFQLEEFPFHEQVVRDWLDTRKESMPSKERFLYYLFKRSSQATKLGDLSGTRKPRTVHLAKGTALKADVRWETGEVYYGRNKEILGGV